MPTVGCHLALERERRDRTAIHASVAPCLDDFQPGGRISTSCARFAARRSAAAAVRGGSLRHVRCERSRRWRCNSRSMSESASSATAALPDGLPFAPWSAQVEGAAPPPAEATRSVICWRTSSDHTSHARFLQGPPDAIGATRREARPRSWAARSLRNPCWTTCSLCPSGAIRAEPPQCAWRWLEHGAPKLARFQAVAGWGSCLKRVSPSGRSRVLDAPPPLWYGAHEFLAVCGIPTSY